jgi:hypothetical protein
MIRKVKKGNHKEIIDNFCPNLGFNHQPYMFLESVCDEMVEERLGRYYTSCTLCNVPVPTYSCIISNHRPCVLRFAYIPIDDILDALKFRDKVLSTGLTPDESFADSLCKELYSCSPSTSKKQNREL